MAVSLKLEQDASLYSTFVDVEFFSRHREYLVELDRIRGLVGNSRTVKIEKIFLELEVSTRIRFKEFLENHQYDQEAEEQGQQINLIRNRLNEIKKIEAIAVNSTLVLRSR